MTVSVPAYTEKEWTGDGSSTIFSFQTRVLEAADIKVFLVENDVETIQAVGGNYSLSGVGSPSGVTITFVTPPTQYQTIKARRETVPKQTIDYGDLIKVPGDTTEEQLDRLAMHGQDVDTRIADVEALTNPFAGPWQVDKQYVANQVVSFEGRLWVALASSVGAEPDSNPALWTVYLDGLSPQGAWNGLVTYRFMDLVEFGGSIWLALRPNVGVEPVEGADWTLFLPGVTVADDSVDEPKLATSLTLQMSPAVGSKAAVKALNTARYTTTFLAAPGLDGMLTWNGGDLSSEMLGPVVTSTAVNSGTGAITKVAHNLTLGEAVIVTTAVNGLATNTLYWVVPVDADNFKLAATLDDARAGTNVTLTGTTNFTTRQHKDPYEGAYITKGPDITGASGAWVRPEIGTGTGKIGWFGTTAYASKAAALAGGFGSANRINACAELFPSVDLGRGSFLCEETVRVKAFVSGVDPIPFGTHFFGVNNYNTRLVAANGLNAPVLDTNGVSSIGLSNFGIDGNGANNTGAPSLLIRNSYYGFIHEVRVLDGPASHAAIYSQGSNNITYTTVFASGCQGAGWFLDPSSRHNVLTTCGVEDFNLAGAVGSDAAWGFTDNGSNNEVINPWFENRNGLATDCAYRSNNRDNRLIGAEFTSSGANPFAIAIQLGGSSDRHHVANPHFSGVTAPVVLLGTNKYRELVNLPNPATDVTNTNSDATTLIRRGNQVFDAGVLQTFTSTNGTSGLRTDIYGGSTNLQRWQNAGSTAWEISGSNHLLPGANNVSDIGNAARRVREIFAVNPTINTSDRNSKAEIGGIPDEWLDAWGDVEWVRFKFRDAVAEKGDAARWHVGVVAQQVKEAFEVRGLDPFALGLLCFDEWEDQYEEEVAPIYDEAGRVIGSEPTGKMVLTIAAGSSYGVRYSEADAMEAAYQRRRTDRLEAYLFRKIPPLPPLKGDTFGIPVRTSVPPV